MRLAQGLWRGDWQLARVESVSRLGRAQGLVHKRAPMAGNLAGERGTGITCVAALLALLPPNEEKTVSAAALLRQAQNLQRSRYVATASFKFLSLMMHISMFEAC